jgi:hypothetical protein
MQETRESLLPPPLPPGGQSDSELLEWMGGQKENEERERAGESFYAPSERRSRFDAL